MELLILLTKIKGIKAYKVSRPSEVMGVSDYFNFWVIKTELPVLFFHRDTNSTLERKKKNSVCNLCFVAVLTDINPMAKVPAIVDGRLKLFER